MKEYNSFADLWTDLESTEQFQEEKSILEFSLQLHQLMESRGITKKDLAESMGVSQAYITKVFRGNANFTIASMIKLVNAVNGKLTIHVTGKEEHNQKWFRSIDGKKGVLRQWKPVHCNISYSSNQSGQLEEFA
jgi:transcriptional regulator with XRE-family HTH domain